MTAEDTRGRPVVTGHAPVVDAGPSVSGALREAAGVLRAATEAAVRPSGLSIAQFSCLEVLRRLPHCSGADVARATHTTRQAAHTLLRTMERQGLVEQHRAPGRALAWTATPVGRRRLRGAERAVRDLDAAIVARLDPGPDAGAAAGDPRHVLTRIVAACLDVVAHPDPGPGGAARPAATGRP